MSAQSTAVLTAPAKRPSARRILGLKMVVCDSVLCDRGDCQKKVWIATVSPMATGTVSAKWLIVRLSVVLSESPVGDTTHQGAANLPRFPEEGDNCLSR